MNKKVPQSRRGSVSARVTSSAMVRGEGKSDTHPLTLSLAVLLAALTAGALLFRVEVREYYLYFTAPRPALSFEFQELSDNWGEDELKAYFDGADLYCLDNAEVALGNRRCYLDINAYNDAPAMGIGFFLNDEHLEYASINLPIWAHGTMHGAMTKRHGAPSLYTGKMGAEPLDIWRLPGGSALFMSRDPIQNPVKWHQLFWASNRACRQFGC